MQTIKPTGLQFARRNKKVYSVLKLMTLGNTHYLLHLTTFRQLIHYLVEIPYLLR
jgi:hypothetical protein